MQPFRVHLSEDALDALKHTLRPLTNPQADGFVLPDGSALSLGSFPIHDNAVKQAGFPTLIAALNQGIVRYVGRSGITVSAPLSSAAARTVHDNFLNEPLTVDVMNPTDGRVHSFKQFGQRHNPDALRSFVDRALEQGKAGIWLQEGSHPQRHSGIVPRFSGFVNQNRPQTETTVQQRAAVDFASFTELSEMAIEPMWRRTTNALWTEAVRVPKALQLEVDAAVAFAKSKGVRVPSISFESGNKNPHLLALYSPSNDGIYINPRAANLSGVGIAKAGYFSTEHRFHTFLHELGHMAHHDKVRSRYDNLVNTNGQLPRFAEVSKEVSRYAERNGLEFVAEVFVGLITGRSFSDAVMSLYAELGGPTV
jgi:hypothetical protein